METGSVAGRRDFDHLREHSIGLPGVLFQSITHMAPAAAVAYSIYISVPLPAYPYRYAAWFALAWIAAGLLIGLVLMQMRPEALKAGERIYVEDEVSGADVPDMPAAAPAH